MATAKEIYDMLFDNKAVTVRIENANKFHTLRVALSKLHAGTVSAGFSSFRLVSRFDCNTCLAAFALKAGFPPDAIPKQQEYSIDRVDPA